MGFLDRLLGRPKQRPAPDPSTTTIAAVNQSYANPGYRKYFSDREPRRKAIASVSRWQSTYGIQRPDYSPAEIDRLAENVIYAMCEKRCMDYASTAEWTVEDGEGNEVGPAIQFLSKPNPQDTFSSLLVATIPDIMRGDCGCWVKTFNGLDKLAELRAYNGDEFWPEVDRGFSPVEGLRGEATYGVYSHGYVVRWWQHSAPGIYVPYDPAEIVYIRMYPRSDSPFGTSLLQRVKWQLEYLIDSTAAAGMTFANGVMPGLEWNHANLQGPEQLAEMIVDREERYVGVQNAGGIIDTFEGDTLKPLTPSMVDMQWLDGQKLVSETVWAYFGFPASEFLMGDTNRATAYIARNIVKSSVLAPMLSRLEGYINGCVLPDLEGYQPDWTFKFIESVDKDDELKDVQVLQGRQQIAMGYYQMGMPLLMCLRLAGLPEEDIEAVKQEEIDAPDIDSDLPGSTHAATQTDDGPITEQYTGTDDAQGHEGSDEGGGGPGGPRTSSATVCPSCGHEWYSKQSGPEITCPKCGNDMPRTTIRKASKEYVSSSHPAPEGAAVHEGPRGGEFYYAGKDGKPAEAPKGNGEAPANKPAGAGASAKDLPVLKTGDPGWFDPGWADPGLTLAKLREIGADVREQIKGNPAFEEASDALESGELDPAEHAGLEAYTNGLFSQMNALERHGSIRGDSQGVTQETNDGFAQLIAKSRIEGGHYLYRGVMKEAAATLYNAPIGGRYLDKGFQAHSLTPGVSAYYREQPEGVDEKISVLIRTVSRDDQPARWISSGNLEVVLQRRTAWKVVGKTKLETESGEHVLVVDLIEDAGQP